VVGSRTLLAAKGIQHPEEQASDGQWLYLTIDGVLRVRTRIYDPLRRDSIPTVASVQNAGLRPFLVSGGSTEEAVTLAQTIGIAPDDVRAEIDTTARSEVLRILQAAGHQVGVIADAQENQDALLEADVGFALIADGNLPAESHEFLLFRPGAGGVMLAFHLATECLRIIRQNILLSAATMSLSFAAMAGYVPTYGAVIGLLTSIGLVGANGLRLRLMAQPKAVALPPPASERQTAH
jgi:Cu+-exporting ATPase